MTNNHNKTLSWPERVSRIILSFFLTKKLVRFVFYKFHGYYNQHKMSLIGAFTLPFLLLLTSVFIKLDKQRKYQIKQKLTYYFPHINQPVFTASNCVRILLQAFYLALFRVTNKTSNDKSNILSWQKVSAFFRYLNLIDRLLVRICKRTWSFSVKRVKAAPYRQPFDSKLWHHRYLKVLFAVLLFLDRKSVV